MRTSRFAIPSYAPPRRRAKRVTLRRTTKLLLASLAAAIALLSPTAGAAPARSPAFTPDCARSDDVVGQFMRAVERGELVIFGRRLAGAHLRPVRIEYAYELGSRAQSVSVHAELVSAIPLPSDGSMVVRSVAAVMGRDGSIEETRTHVTLK